LGTRRDATQPVNRHLQIAAMAVFDRHTACKIPVSLHRDRKAGLTATAQIRIDERDRKWNKYSAKETN
jgi:hypothetical protein